MAGPAQAFHSAANYGAGYELHFCASSPEISSAQGLIFKTETELPDIGRNDLIVVPGQWSKHIKDGKLLNARIIAWLREAYKSEAHLASVCSGAFALGEAGFLNGRRCTTHWSLTDELQRRYPDARVATTALYVHDGRITTSAGIASGIDMALSLIELHYGPTLTAKVARDLVVFLRRHGGHDQTSIYLSFRDHLHQLGQRQAESDRTAIVLHQQDVTLDLESVGELLNDVSEVIERISKLFRRRSITMTKPGIVRSDHMVTVGQLRNQSGEHARRRGESVEHQDRGSILRSGFTIEHLHIIDGNRSITHSVIFANHRVVRVGLFRGFNGVGKWTDRAGE